MKEHEFQDLLYEWIDPIRDPECARRIVEGLARQLPPERRSRYSQDLWAWTTNRRPPTPDLMLGDCNDEAVSVLELKRSFGQPNPINYHMVRTMRQTLSRSSFGDPVSLRVQAKYLDTDILSEFEDPHDDAKCVGTPYACEVWKMKPGTGLHYPAAHQGDTYASTLAYLPEGLQAATPRDLDYILLSPSAACTERFQSGLVSRDIWHIVRIDEAYRYWAEQAVSLPALRPFVQATARYLNFSETSAPAA